MARKKVSIFIMIILLLYIPSHAVGNDESYVVPKFGIGFDEVVIADSSDGLDDPRDLEFHPGRANELWIANRATDSISIIHNTGLLNQTSENRHDAYGNHFLEEVSAISFGSYHPEFDWQWGSAQESVNTYCGLGSPNNFMGPTLWPSSLSHFAVEHQDDEYLGSHIDMNHESPFGMGIAHDSDNSYWYNDGYYEELVYYDFQEDHDTGMDDHSDGIVRRYSEIELTHSYGTPGHMILDKDSGILYISDPGADRVLWVNTDDSTYQTQDIMSDSSRLEPLAEYSRITGVEWGVLDSGLNKPSGIALEGDQLFISQNGDNRIIAYNLSSNGKSATEVGSIQTSASKIMGLEIGPNGHLYYVDNGKDEVVRIDPLSDEDNDGIIDEEDNCPLVANPNQADYDSDLQGDACDLDDDNDGIPDESDLCPSGDSFWTSSLSTDYDNDGCRDYSEDDDDDNDGFLDSQDDCPLDAGTSDSGRLFGCLDTDGDGHADAVDEFPNDSSQWSDVDEDGYGDRSDGINGDDCVAVFGTSTSDRTGCLDSDGDGYSNPDSNWGIALGADAFPNDVTQHIDSDGDDYGDNQSGFQADECPQIAGNSTQDRFGCLDTDGDGWSDQVDEFSSDPTQYLDSDDDGYGDSQSGNLPDSCPEVYGLSNQEKYGCPDSDGDGWSDELDAFPEDERFWSDKDGDGHPDREGTEESDDCPDEPGDSYEDRIGCLDSDGDGWSDEGDYYPDDASRYSESSNISTILIITGIAIAVIVLGLILYIGRRNGKGDILGLYDSGNMIPIIQTGNKGPPLPPEGLPAGWTMEQWEWYGEEYLKNR